MFTNLKLAAKISLGFGIVIVIAATIGLVGWNSLNSVSHSTQISDNAAWMSENTLMARRHEKDFMLRKDVQYLQKAEALVDEFRQKTDETLTLVSSDEQGMVREVQSKVEAWLQAMEEYVSLEEQKTATSTEMVNQARIAIDGVETLLTAQHSKLEEHVQNSEWTEIADRLTKVDIGNANKAGLLETRRSEKDYMLRGDVKYIARFHEFTREIISTTQHLRTLHSKAEDQQRADDVINSVTGYDQKFTEYVTMVDAQAKQASAMGDAAHELMADTEILRENAQTAAEDAKSSAITILLLLLIAGVVVGSVLAYTTTTSIVRPINQVVSALATGSEQVSSASQQVSSSSQVLAEGASEQASGLEETSASLEEMASMARQNADNSKQADTLARDAQTAADKGSNAMTKMSTAINEMKTSSDETAKIIKVIDEIAFQTNLLALNAAVEAARAGEAGKGFAVVAEEVRNLAQRSAEAAKNTNDLIEQSQKNAENGVRVTDEVGTALTEISNGIKKVSGLVGEISAASQEQAQGVDQVNTAVSQMDEITQRNASSAEESASASEELTALSSQMDNVVISLQGIVNGASGAQNVQKVQSAQNNSVTTKQALPVAVHTQNLLQTTAPNGNNGHTQKTSQVIPLDDSDFSDF
jgi:methyl-accepting chemotaxis protein